MCNFIVTQRYFHMKLVLPERINNTMWRSSALNSHSKPCKLNPEVLCCLPRTPQDHRLTSSSSCELLTSGELHASITNLCGEQGPGRWRLSVGEEEGGMRSSRARMEEQQQQQEHLACRGLLPSPPHTTDPVTANRRKTSDH